MYTLEELDQMDELFNSSDVQEILDEQFKDIIRNTIDLYEE